MDTAHVRESPAPKTAGYKVQETPRKLQRTPRIHPGPSPGNAIYERNPDL